MKLGKPNYPVDENEGDPKANSPPYAPPTTSLCSEFISEDVSLRQVALVGNPKLSMWVL